MYPTGPTIRSDSSQFEESRARNATLKHNPSTTVFIVIRCMLEVVSENRVPMRTFTTLTGSIWPQVLLSKTSA